MVIVSARTTSSKMRNGISAVLIVKDEEAVLERCLKSLDGVEEIVVLDTGSTDKTVEIAKACGAKVYIAPPIVPFHFAEARNMALALATEDWIVTIDADEIAHPEFLKKVRKIIKRYPDATGFNIKFIVSSEGGENSASIPKLKVFRRGCWEWLYRIHEILSPLKTVFQTKVLDLDTAVMEHLPQADKELRRQQNLDLLQVSVKESPEYIRNARQLGMELFSREQYREAIQYLEMYLTSGTGGPLDRSETYVHLGRCYSNMGIHDQARSNFDLATHEAPMRRECYYFKAIALIKEARPDLAIQVLEACLAIPEGSKPDFYLNLDRVWDGQYPQEALDFCKKTVQEHEASKVK